MADTAPTDTNDQPLANGADTEPQVGILAQYVKDLSFENPNAPRSFQMEGQPRVEVNVNVGARRAGEDVYEVDLRINATESPFLRLFFTASTKESSALAAAAFEISASAAIFSTNSVLFISTLLIPSKYSSRTYLTNHETNQNISANLYCQSKMCILSAFFFF